MDLQHTITKKEIVLELGMEVDLTEAWRNLISSQFGGSPGRGFGELIQNFLDSYPASTPWRAKRGEIVTTGNSISLTDFGEGMDLTRLQLLVTLGGTDKRHDPTKIGTFGMGFFSIFNPLLATRRVAVTTRCQDRVVELLFLIEDSSQCPEIRTRVVEGEVAFSTRMEVVFGSVYSPGKCLEHARKCLHYYPCSVTINGLNYRSIWEQAEGDGSRLFQSGECHGIFHADSRRDKLDILCKYEPVMSLRVPTLATGGHNMHYDLRDYRKKQLAFVPGKTITVNSNSLNVTISRDSYRMDWAYDSLVRVMEVELLRELDTVLEADDTRGLLVTNQFILAGKLQNYFKEPARQHPPALVRLATAKVYQLNGRKGLHSLQEIMAMHDKALPLFFSPGGTNVKWLGGAFRHDFVVLPPPCRTGGGAPRLFDELFATLFGEIVNLETVDRDEETLARLIGKGIIAEALLRPDCSVVEKGALSKAQGYLLQEIGMLLALPAVRDTVALHLGLVPNRLGVVFFESRTEGLRVATGLFDQDGVFLSGRQAKTEEIEQPEDGQIMFGLNLNNELVKVLLDSTAAHRVCFLLPILIDEMLQARNRLGLTGGPVTHRRKERLAGELRRALLAEMLVGSEGEMVQ